MKYKSPYGTLYRYDIILPAQSFSFLEFFVALSGCFSKIRQSGGEGAAEQLHSMT
jgi:hypothetical protein